MFDTRIVEDMPFAEYAHLDAVNASYLTTFAQRTPAAALWDKMNPKTETAAMTLGRALHTMVLEPDKVKDRIIVAPETINKRTNKGKEEWAALVTSGKDILKAQDFAQLGAMAERLRLHEELTARLKRGRKELTILWEMDGIKCKARLDLVADNMAFDIKTSRRTNEHGMRTDIVNFGYDLKAAWYLLAATQAGLNNGSMMWVWAFVENVPPFEPSMWVMDPDWQKNATDAIMTAWARFRECYRSNNHPGHHTGIKTMHAPNWATDRKGMVIRDTDPNF